MDNRNQPRIGCNLGEGIGSRTKIIDPNAFYDEKNSSRNIPVNNEDLTISVKLTTRKKSRTTLSSDSTNDTSVVKEQKGATINFIEGSEINGKKTLTTKFTELTTVFEGDTVNPETFGITNIDIDFNSSHTPMIRIDFIDVRGSSIFQNEEYLLENNSSNKYSTFFEFPYPLFELEIKGYYGQPVTYCLHMLKFNSKFNSKTGNFEISCDFIGYTYAMLSDMLIGILRVIPYTKIGQEKLKKYNENRENPIIDLVELKNKIDNINNEIQKVSQNSEEAKIINVFTEAKKILNSLEIQYNNFFVEFSLAKDESSNSIDINPFVVMSNDVFSDLETKKFNEFANTIKDLITSYNELNIVGLNLDFNKTAVKYYVVDLTINQLQPDYNLVISNNPELKNVSDVNSFKKDLLNYLASSLPTKLNDNFIFKVLDLRSRYEIVTNQIKLVDENLKNTQKELANKIKDNVTDTLGFKPTVRNMIEVFTALIEVFIESVYEVSTKAEAKQERKDLFKKVFGDNNVGSDYNNNDFNYYPWPAYSEKENDKTGYVDKYLGDNAQVKNRIFDVPELEFIDDLLQAFITAKRKAEELTSTNSENLTAYIPTNPLDTSLFGLNGNSYSRKELINLEQIRRLALIRAMTYLGYTNNEKYLTEEEILKMAELEANALLTGLVNPKLRVAISQLKVDEIINTFGKINGVNTKVITEFTNDKYYYTYYYEDPNSKEKNVKLLPINSDLNNITLNPQSSDLLDFKESGNIFLTNYNSGANATKETNKPDDGGVYIKMFTPTEFNNSVAPLIDTTLGENIINLEALKADELNIETIGFNSFGGNYGIQEFVNMDFGDGTQEGIPLFFNFYTNSANNLANMQSDTYSIAITRKRFKEKNKLKNDIVYSYDYSPNKEIYIVTSNDYIANKSKSHTTNYDFLSIINENDENLSYPYIEYKTCSLQSTRWNNFSLFGSSWYYLQENSVVTSSNFITYKGENYVKALLFLNTIPFNNEVTLENYNDPLFRNDVNRLFNIRGGFIHTPRLWAAYIGGLLWWMSSKDPVVDSNDLIIGGGRGISDPVVWKWSCNVDFGHIPDSTSTFYGDRDLFPKVLDTSTTLKIKDSILSNLPEQVKNEFKKIFFDFVNGTDSNYINFPVLKEQLEIKKTTNSGFCDFLDKIQKLESNGGYLLIDNDKQKKYFKSSVLTENLKNVNNYSVIIPNVYPRIAAKEWYDYSLFLELKDNTEITKNLVTAFKEEIIIANTGYAIWTKGGLNTSGPYANEFTQLREPIGVSKANFDKYFNKFTNIINNGLIGSTLTNELEKEINEIFGTSNKNDIKLMLYRHCKNIYDKWLGGVTNPDNVIFQCGDTSRNGSNRKTIDLEMAKKYGRTKPRLIDSFRFVTRSFKDIGDELFINPLPINEQINEMPNTSAYSVISGLLNDNKFDFISLPTFINYRDDEMLKSVFTPYQYSDSITSCGPTFVCVYVGQKSNSLDLKSSKYPNDGFDMRCINGNVDTSIPTDYSDPLNSYEDPVSVFVVNYSQQNQNIFKDITLDQSEFTETEESLKIVQDISMNGSENNPTFGGQNMYNVYAVRSYSAEIEMLGNAMIQPMMYFQLDNIPMFHGAYMIIRTKHNIKPNHMTTWFTGTRIRAVESPIINIADAYMSLIETLDLSSAGTTKNVSVGLNKNYINDFKSDLVNSIPSDKTIIGVPLPNPKALTQKAEAEFLAWKNGGLKESEAVNLLDKYAKATPGFNASDYSNNSQPWSATFVSYLMLAGDPDFMNSTLHYNYVSSSMKGINGYETFPLKSGLKIKPEIGCIFCKPRSGSYTASHCDVLYKIENNTAFLIGGNLSDSVKVIEIDLINGYITDSSNVRDYDIIILKTNNKYYNNKNLIGVADFNNDNQPVIISNKADYWSLVAICAAENFKDNPQGMADVAQSIYNRLYTPNKAYGKTIKEIIVAPKQYQPTYKNINDWKKINDKETAIIALMNSKNYSKSLSEEYINISINAIKNSELKQNSLRFVGTRTEFLAEPPTNSSAIGVVERIPKSKNNAFYWRYAGLALINSEPLAGPNFLV